MNAKNSRPYRRRNYYVERSLQLRFILNFFLLVMLAGILTIGILYLLSSRGTTVAIINSRVVVRSTADFILPLLVQTVAVVTVMASIAAIISTLLLSHKIAGPLYRLKKMLKSIEEGDFTSELHLRRLDQEQMQEIARIFNGMVAKVRTEVSSVKKGHHTLKEKLGGISEADISQEKRAALSELKKAIDDLDRSINYFKT